MRSRAHRTCAAIEFSEKAASTNIHDNIWEKLKCRAQQLGYGSLTCDVQVHGGQIRQIEITVVKEKLRAD